MAVTGHGAQIVTFDENHNLQLNEDELKKILMNDNVKELPVMVVSISGPYRGGRSFLLNFFLRYLTALPSARADGSWLGGDNEPLVGFDWRGGSRKVTTGIVMWSQPFVALSPSGEKVAVLLLDTLGTFDSESTVRESCSVFMLSSLLSSLQIYNLRETITEDDLRNLMSLVSYGTLFKDHSGKAFQELKFLVRDYDMYAGDYPYGATGGEALLQERLQIKPNMPDELRDIRTGIRSTFDKMSCFLMSHPGFVALHPKFKGNVGDISREFRDDLGSLVPSMFTPGQLQPKVVLGRKLKTRHLLSYFKAYINVLNGNIMPMATSIMQATLEAGYMSSFEEELKQYKDYMSRKCGATMPNWFPAVDFDVIHNRYKSLVQLDFVSRENYEFTDYYKLSQEIDKLAEEYRSFNVAKQLKAIESAKAAFDAEICKSRDDVNKISRKPIEEYNSKALEAAFQVYNAKRKRYSTKPDNGIIEFIQEMEKKYTVPAIY